MAMTRKQQRTTMIVAGLSILGLAVALTLYNLKDTMVFFYTPGELISKNIAPGTRVRIGGLVEQNSVVKHDGTSVSFAITDTDDSIKVAYNGTLPDLFREGQGVVCEGVLGANGNFTADTVFAKHDEKYMPREVADALKAKGVWKEGEEASGQSQ